MIESASTYTGTFAKPITLKLLKTGMNITQNLLQMVTMSIFSGISLFILTEQYKQIDLTLWLKISIQRHA